VLSVRVSVVCHRLSVMPCLRMRFLELHGHQAISRQNAKHVDANRFWVKWTLISARTRDALVTERFRCSLA
jgi:hypothetical protein